MQEKQTLNLFFMLDSLQRQQTFPPKYLYIDKAIHSSVIIYLTF